MLNFPSQLAQSLLGINLMIWVIVEFRELSKIKEKTKKKDLKTIVLFAVLITLFTTLSVIIFQQKMGFINQYKDFLFWFGIFLINFGIFIRQYSMVVLGNSYVATLQIQDKPTIIKKGPFSIVRHPCYTGFIISIWGFGLTFSNWIFLISVIIFSLFVFLIQIHIEERELENYFGEEYKEYEKQTKKLFPFTF